MGTLTCKKYPGSKFYLQLDAETFASWEVDMLKLDCCYAGSLLDLQTGNQVHILTSLYKNFYHLKYFYFIVILSLNLLHDSNSSVYLCYQCRPSLACSSLLSDHDLQSTQSTVRNFSVTAPVNNKIDLYKLKDSYVHFGNFFG